MLEKQIGAGVKFAPIFYPTLLLPSLRGKTGVKKSGLVGRAGISSKFHKCGHLGGKGNKALQL